MIMKKKNLKKDINLGYLVPTVIENTNRGERAYDIYSRLLKDRIVIINGPIHSGLGGLIVAQILFLEKEDPKKDIYLYINSPGGSVTEGLAIFDAMQSVSCDVVTVGIGMCASMGAFLLAAGTKGKRFATPNVEVMIHQPLTGVQGQISDIEITALQGLRTKELMLKYLQQFTGQKEELIRKHIERDYWLNAKEALEYGIVDEIVESKKKKSWDPVFIPRIDPSFLRE